MINRQSLIDKISSIMSDHYPISTIDRIIDLNDNSYVVIASPIFGSKSEPYPFYIINKRDSTVGFYYPFVTEEGEEEFISGLKDRCIYSIKGEGTIMHNISLWHHGIKGQKWGVRRFQNPDGSLTVMGRARYGSSESNTSNTEMHDPNKFDKIDTWEKVGEGYAERVGNEQDRNRRINRPTALKPDQPLLEMDDDPDIFDYEYQDRIQEAIKKYKEAKTADEQRKWEREAVDLHDDYIDAWSEVWKSDPDRYYWQLKQYGL